MTEQQAIDMGMDDFEIAYGIMVGDIEPMQHMTPDEKEHGKVVACRWEPYHDVTVYEDGYEAWFPIGD